MAFDARDNDLKTDQSEQNQRSVKQPFLEHLWHFYDLTWNPKIGLSAVIVPDTSVLMRPDTSELTDPETSTTPKTFVFTDPLILEKADSILSSFSIKGLMQTKRNMRNESNMANV